MAKPWYKIAASLDRSFLDHEIALNPSLRPTPIKQLLFFAGGGFVLLWAATSTFISNASPMFIAAFVIWGLLAIIYFGRMTKTKELIFMQVPPLISYLPAPARKVSTRRSSNPTNLYSVVSIQEIEEDGLIRFGDGTVGQAYLVVGSASYLLFDEDRTAILDQVDAFWRKVEPTCEWIFVTTKEPQRIYHQVASLEERNQALKVRDPDLIELQNEQYDILTEHVGGKFSSIHQYLVLKAKSEDALNRAVNVLQAEVEGTGMMFKEATALDREEVEPMLQVFYQGVDRRQIAPASV